MKAVSCSVRNSAVVTFTFCVLAVAANVATAQLLYSFETPDDPGTPSVDESLEGWGAIGPPP